MPRQIHNSPAERVAAFRARHDLVTLSVDVPRDVRDGLQQYMKFKNVTKSAVITKLIRDQLLRKR